jgi:hypothetical protein
VVVLSLTFFFEASTTAKDSPRIQPIGALLKVMRNMQGFARVENEEQRADEITRKRHSERSGVFKWKCQILDGCQCRAADLKIRRAVRERYRFGLKCEYLSDNLKTRRT